MPVVKNTRIEKTMGSTFYNLCNVKYDIAERNYLSLRCIKPKIFSMLTLPSVWQAGMCLLYIRYLALFEVSGIWPDSTTLSGRIPDIFIVQGNCAD